MKRVLIYIFAIFLSHLPLILSAQILNTSFSDTSQLQEENGNLINENAKNFIKINLAALIFKSYSLEYERILSKRVSLALTLKTMPENSLPFKNLLIKNFGEDEFDRNAIENFRLNSFSQTFQIRYYLSKKGYGRGFYVAPFYVHSNFSVNKLPSQYISSSSERPDEIVNFDNSGKFSSNTGGILVGAQWMIGKHLSFDWTIAGPHYGLGSGSLIGIAERDLTIDEQNNINEMWDDSSISGYIKNVSVNEKGEVLDLDGPWGGLKFMLSLGIRF